MFAGFLATRVISTFVVFPVFGSVTQTCLSLRILSFCVPPSPLAVFRFVSPKVVSAGKEPSSNRLFFLYDILLPPEVFFLRMPPCQTDTFKFSYVVSSAVGYHPL